MQTSIFPRLFRPDPQPGQEALDVLHGNGPPSQRERAFLLGLQRQSLQYFLDNQGTSGLVLDRQRNHAPSSSGGLYSTSATGMGLIALALASAPPHRLIGQREAVLRVRRALTSALEQLPHDHGIMPHFVDSATGQPYGRDPYSTVDSAWMIAGAAWAAAYLKDSELESLARTLYERVDWVYWSTSGDASPALLRHGKGPDGNFLASCWDRLNGETVFMYVMAAGAASPRAIGPECCRGLGRFYGTVAGLRFHSADLGLFVFQYGLDLLDMTRWHAPDGLDLWAEARIATAANHWTCRLSADRFTTYRTCWGISAGDGPAAGSDRYQCYSPAEPLDGTAHITATVAAVPHCLDAVLENLSAAQKLQARGRYGFSSVNVDLNWTGKDMIGIDAGAAVLALDNFLSANRVRTVFHSLDWVGRGLQRLGFTDSRGADLPDRQAS